MKNLTLQQGVVVANAAIRAIVREGFTFITDEEYYAFIKLRRIFETQDGKWLGLDNVAKCTAPEEIKQIWQKVRDAQGLK